MKAEMFFGYVEAYILWGIAWILGWTAVGCEKAGIAAEIICKWSKIAGDEIVRDPRFWKEFLHEGMVFRAAVIADGKDDVYDNNALY